jgi:hypothetical protein
MIVRRRRPPRGGIVSLAFFLSFAMAATGFADEAKNVRLRGYHGLQGRPALQVVLQGRPALQVVLKGDFAYVGHHSGTAINPLSGKREPNGTSIMKGDVLT